MAKRRRLRLKTRAYEVLFYFAFFIYLVVYTTSHGIDIHEEREYRKTDEYLLIEKGYSKSDVKLFKQKLSDIEINVILENEYNSDYAEILRSKYFIYKNYDSYVSYKEYHPKEDVSTVIALVNTNVTKGWYNEEYVSQVKDEYLVIANKFYKLPDDYSRDDIVNIDLAFSYDGNKVSQVVYDAFLEMYSDIKNELDVHLMVNNSYRSYKLQENIYNTYKAYGSNYADKVAARPGHSEHQTGLVLNISSRENPLDTFDDSDEFKWLKENAHKYGFIQRYPEGKENITGFSENWLFRYVGVDVATKIYNEGITFDEYYAYYIEEDTK